MRLVLVLLLAACNDRTPVTPGFTPPETPGGPLGSPPPIEGAPADARIRQDRPAPDAEAGPVLRGEGFEVTLPEGWSHDRQATDGGALYRITDASGRRVATIHEHGRHEGAALRLGDRPEQVDGVARERTEGSSDLGEGPTAVTVDRFETSTHVYRVERLPGAADDLLDRWRFTRR